MAVELLLRGVQFRLDLLQLALQRLDVRDRGLHGARLAVVLLRRRQPRHHDPPAASRRSVFAQGTGAAAAGATAFLAHRRAATAARRCGWREKGGDLLERGVDPRPPPLLREPMRRSFRREVRGERFRVRNTREMGAFEEVLVIRLRRQDERGGFGADHCCD